MTPNTSARREDIDALRIGATYLLFAFHTAMIFNPAPFYHIRNDELSFVMLIVTGFISLWHMPLFFLLAGWATHASLQHRGRTGYVRERISKLFIPLIAGIILFGPVIKFLELRSGLDLSHTGLRVAPALQESFRVVIPSGLGCPAQQATRADVRAPVSRLSFALDRISGDQLRHAVHAGCDSVADL